MSATYGTGGRCFAWRLRMLRNCQGLRLRAFWLPSLGFRRRPTRVWLATLLTPWCRRRLARWPLTPMGGKLAGSGCGETQGLSLIPCGKCEPKSGFSSKLRTCWLKLRLWTTPLFESRSPARHVRLAGLDLFYFVLTNRFLPPLRHWVQILIRVPSAVLAHCKFGCLRWTGMRLYLVARTRLE